MKFTRLFVATLAMAGLMYGCGNDSKSSEEDAPVPENTAELCADDKDNDGNGVKDCEEDSCKGFDNCKGEDKECTAEKPAGKTCTCDKATGEWTDCQDAAEKQCPTDMPSGKKDCTCDKTTGEWTNCQDDTAEKQCPTDMPSGKKDCTCDKTTGEWTNCQDDTAEKQCPTDMPSGKKDCTCDKTTGEWTNCQDDVVADTDENKNHMKDSKEPGMASAATCKKQADCTAPMFCDSFIGKCADKCASNDDCMTGFICRPDGRCAAEAFETVWKTTEDNEDIYLPEITTCNGTIDWGDGSDPETITACPDYKEFKHTYATAGDHHIKLTGEWEGWCLGSFHIGASCIKSDADAAKLIEVVSYGPVGIRANGFASAKNLTKLSTIDIPDSTKLGQKNGDDVYASDMFYYCENLEKGVAKWDLGNVTNLDYFFSGAKKFNERLHGWDTSKITSFYGMFWGAEALDSNPANDWDLTKAKNMARMFSDTTKASLNFMHTKQTKPESITSCEGIKDMYTGSAVDCDSVKIAGEDVPALSSCKKKDYKAECN